MGSTPESLLVNRIRKALLKDESSLFVTKIHGGPYQTAGLPDLLVIFEGRALWLEVKAPRPRESRAALMRRVTVRQGEMLYRLRRAGCVAEVVSSEEEALVELAKLKDLEIVFPTT